MAELTIVKVNFIKIFLRKRNNINNLMIKLIYYNRKKDHQYGRKYLRKKVGHEQRIYI